MTDPFAVGDKVRHPAHRSGVPDLLGSVRAVFTKLNAETFVIVEMTGFYCGGLMTFRPEELEIDDG